MQQTRRRSPMVSLHDVTFAYPGGTFGLAVPELQVGPGESVAVIGASGSGKSTLLSLVAGILPPTAGQIVVDDTDVSALDDAGRRRFRLHSIGLVFQEFELLDHLDVRDNVLLPCRLSGQLGVTDALQSRAESLIADVGLADKTRRNVRHLSQGERQRVAFARGLLLRPPLLLCDEPTGNLDPGTTTHVLDVLLGHVRATGTTLIVVTHDHDLLSQFDRVLDMKTFHQRDDAG